MGLQSPTSRKEANPVATNRSFEANEPGNVTRLVTGAVMTIFSAAALAPKI
jgi:hypothetical protein